MRAGQGGCRAERSKRGQRWLCGHLESQSGIYGEDLRNATLPRATTTESTTSAGRVCQDVAGRNALGRPASVRCLPLPGSSLPPPSGLPLPQEWPPTCGVPPSPPAALLLPSSRIVETGGSSGWRFCLLVTALTVSAAALLGEMRLRSKALLCGSRVWSSASRFLTLETSRLPLLSGTEAFLSVLLSPGDCVRTEQLLSLP